MSLFQTITFKFMLRHFISYIVICNNKYIIYVIHLLHNIVVESIEVASCWKKYSALALVEKEMLNKTFNSRAIRVIDQIETNNIFWGFFASSN